MLTECAVIVLASPAAGAGDPGWFFYSTSENPYVRKTSSLETVPSACYCLRMPKTPRLCFNVLLNKFQNVQLGFVWFVAMSQSFNA